MPQKSHGPSVKDDATYERLREQGRSKAAAARIANAGKTGSKRGGGVAILRGLERGRPPRSSTRT
jgi:hypothetical protein